MVENVVITNTVLGVNLELDKVTTPWFILDYINWGQIEADQNTNKYVGQHGESLVSNLLGTRDIELSGWIIATSEVDMSSRKRYLNQFVNPLQMMQVTYGQYCITFYPTTTIEYSDEATDNNEVVCKFMIEGTAYDPLFADVDTSKVIAANVVGMFHFPLVIPEQPDKPGGVVFGSINTSLTMNAVNKGSMTTGMTIMFSARGHVKNPVLTNVNTQEYFRLNKEMQAGEVVKVDTVIGSKSIRGELNGVRSNYFKYRDFGSTWLQLYPGDNLFVYGAEEDVENLEVTIEFYNRYLEVQECN